MPARTDFDWKKSSIPCTSAAFSVVFADQLFPVSMSSHHARLPAAPHRR
jgi:hypothetical protein